MLVLGWVIGCGHTAEQPPVERSVTSKPRPVLVFEGPAPKNLLMVSLDTLRRDHVGRYGDPETTPFWAAFATEGVVLDQNTSCSNWTLASTSCTQAGAYDVDFGWAAEHIADNRTSAPDVPTLARSLSDAGYSTSLASTNRFLGGLLNNAQGYQWIEVRYKEPAENIAEVGLAHLAELRADDPLRPWFLHLHLMEAHRPYAPPDPYLGGLARLDPIPYDLTELDGYLAVAEDWAVMTPEVRELVQEHYKERYKASVRWLDDQLAALHDRLDREGLLDDTLVVYWTDHGEQLWDHGEHGHGEALFREETDALGLFWARNLAARTWDGPTTNADLVPTILDALGQPVPPEMTGTVVGLAPPDRLRYAESVTYYGPMQSIRQGDDKLVLTWYSAPVTVPGGSRPDFSVPSAKVERYDLGADPLEAVDLYDPADPGARALELWAPLLERARALQAITPHYVLQIPVGLPQ